MNPKSADYVHKAKAKMLQKLPAPQLKQAVGYRSNASDNEDASTRVSSKSQAQRNHYYQKQNVNLEYLNAAHDSQTPVYVSNKLDHVSRRHESYNYDNMNVNVANNHHQLPQIKPNARMNSVDIDRMEREQRLNCYIVPQQVQSARGNSRYQHRNESLGVSRALGINNNRYEGVSSAIRLARAASKDSIPAFQPRGPCPTYLSKVQSNGHIPLADRPALMNYQSEPRALQAIYGSRRLQVA